MKGGDERGIVRKAPSRQLGEVGLFVRLNSDLRSESQKKSLFSGKWRKLQKSVIRNMPLVSHVVLVT